MVVNYIIYIYIHISPKLYAPHAKKRFNSLLTHHFCRAGVSPQKSPILKIRKAPAPHSKLQLRRVSCRFSASQRRPVPHGPKFCWDKQIRVSLLFGDNNGQKHRKVDVFCFFYFFRILKIIFCHRT